MIDCVTDGEDVRVDVIEGVGVAVSEPVEIGVHVVEGVSTIETDIGGVRVCELVILFDIDGVIEGLTPKDND